MRRIILCTMTVAFGLMSAALSARDKSEELNPALIKIREVYITGSQKSSIGWAKKRLNRYTCLEPVTNLEEADAILRLEKVQYRPAAEIPQDLSGAIRCTERTSGPNSKLTCADSTGAGTRIRCQTKPNGDTTCSAYYLNPVPAMNLLAVC